MNQCQVAYLLIGGMNYLLRHQTLLTVDIDLWIADSEANRLRCEAALAALDAQWGRTDATWEPVRNKPPHWLDHQPVLSLNSPHGAIDIFKLVPGLADWQASWQSSIAAETPGGVCYHGICDEDMLRSNGAASWDSECDLSSQSFSQLIARETAKRERNCAPKIR